MAEPPLPMSTERQQIASLSILLQISMLGLAFVLGHILRRHKFYYLHEASASLLIGLLVGGIARLSSPEKSFSNWFNFHEEFFFLFLLPPIIFESGFSMQPQPFFSNFGAICTFAILGTIISTAITGILVYLGGLLSLMYSLPFLDSLIFGSIISATDPVSILAVFQELGTDVNLYALVFGESVLNDAVAMSLYRTLMSVRQHPSANYNITTATWSFLVIFVGSLGSGVSVALLCALLFKYAGLHVHKLQHLECCLIVLFPYFAYMSAEGLGLSGIVAILFCGILMKHYTFPNLSESAQEFTAAFFQLIASLAETFVFMYMGVDIANERHRWSHVGFIFFSILIIIVARAANVFPLAHCINKVRPASQKIPIQHQKALWFSVVGCTGLRGAMAFALALQSVHDIGDSHGQAIFTTTTTIVVLTVLVIGGSTSTMLEKLDVATDKVEYISVATVDRDELDHLESASSDDDKVAVPIPKTKISSTLQSLRKSTSFKELDRRFLRPFFTTSKSDSKLLGRPSNSFNESEINDRESSKLGHSKSDTGVHFCQSIESVSYQLQNRNPITTQEIFQIDDEDS